MNFDDSFVRLLGNEGHYSDNPTDPGGATCWGVTERTARANGYAGAMIDMTQEQAKAIYLRCYWGPVGCDAVPDVLKFDLFDMAVNQGVRTAIEAMQYAAGSVADGVLGPLTLQKLQSMDPGRLLFRFDAARLVNYAELPTPQWDEFGRGWARRVANNMLNDWSPT